MLLRLCTCALEFITFKNIAQVLRQLLVVFLGGQIERLALKLYGFGRMARFAVCICQLGEAAPVLAFGKFHRLLKRSNGSGEVPARFKNKA